MSVKRRKTKDKKSDKYNVYIYMEYLIIWFEQKTIWPGKFYCFKDKGLTFTLKINIYMCV